MPQQLLHGTQVVIDVEHGGTEVELRPVFEPADFGAEMTPELRAQEDRLRATVEAKLAAPEYRVEIQVVAVGG